MSETSVIDSAKGNEVAVQLSQDLIRELRSLCELMDVPAEVAMRYAIGTTYYIQNEIRKGSSIVIKRTDGKFYELEWNEPEAAIKAIKL